MSDHTKKLSNDNVMRLRYHREVSLKNLTRLKAPTIVLEKATRMVRDTVDEMRERELTEEQYKKFSDVFWEEHASEEINIDMKMKCLVWLRHSDKSIMEDTDVPAPCTQRNASCGHFCKEWVAATEEQQLRFYHHLDIDTGEELPPSPGMLELFGEDVL